mgnify:CR=1 FL=1
MADNFIFFSLFIIFIILTYLIVGFYKKAQLFKQLNQELDGLFCRQVSTGLYYRIIRTREVVIVESLDRSYRLELKYHEIDIIAINNEARRILAKVFPEKYLNSMPFWR